MLNTPFPSWPSFSMEEIEAVSDVLSSNRVNQWTGSQVTSFEAEFAGYTGSEHAIALANGTLALDIALKALEIGPGDEVIVTPRTFIASASSVVTAGAIPVFADIDRDTQNLCIRSVEANITSNTKAVIVVHLAGMPSDMDAMMELAQKYDIKVIEDCAQAHGALWNGRSVGTHGHIGAWSFCQDKIMSTGGEGGMVTTDDKTLWEKMWALKDHGKSHETVFKDNPEPGYRWLHESFGTNARLTEMQAAIGRIQTRRMPEWHKARLSHANEIWNACRFTSWLRVPEIPSKAEHAAYKCYVFVKQEELPDGWSRDYVIELITAQGVPAYQGTCGEVYLEKAFENTPWRPANRLPVAQELGETSLMFLVHPTLEQSHIEATVAAIRSVDADIRKTKALKVNV